MKLTVFIALFFALAMSAVSAEPRGDGQERERTRQQGDRGPRNPVANLTEALSLSDDQAAAIEAIFEAQRAEREAMRETMEAEHKARQAARCAQRADVEAQIIAVLTDEQAAQFVEMKAKRAEKKARRAERMAEGMAERSDGEGDTRHRRRGRGDPTMDDCENVTGS